MKGSDYSTISDLVSPDLLAIPDDRGRLLLHIAIEYNPEDNESSVYHKSHQYSSFFYLLIREYPAALIALVDGKCILSFIQSTKPNSKFKMSTLEACVMNCLDAYKAHNFPHLIELCGTSDALEALVAAHVEEDLSLHVLSNRDEWDKVIARINRLPTQATVDELFYQDELGETAFAVAALVAPVEVLENMLELGKLDAAKRNIMDVAGSDGCLPLHYAAEPANEEYAHLDNAAPLIRCLIRHQPKALLAKDKGGKTPLDVAVVHAKIKGEDGGADTESLVLLRKATAAYRTRDYPALSALCGNSTTLDQLHSLSLRSATMLCLELIAKLNLQPDVDDVTKKAIWLLSSVNDRERGISREILSYLG